MWSPPHRCAMRLTWQHLRAKDVMTKPVLSGTRSATHHVGSAVASSLSHAEHQNMTG